MSDAYLYENARVKSLETKLVTQQQLQRLLDASSKEEAFKLLIEFGIGGGINVEDNDFDSLFDQEEKIVASLMRELNSSGSFDAILLLNDYHNLKACIKGLVMKTEPQGLMGEGLYSIDAINAAVKGDSKSLRDGMLNAIKRVEEVIATENVNPRSIDVTVDKAMYEDIFDILSRGDKMLKEYFINKVDYANILTYLRCNKWKLNVEFFKDSFIPGASITEGFFVDCYPLGIEEIKKQLKFTDYANIVESINEESFVTYEVTVDNKLLKKFRNERSEMFSSAPILGYHFGRLSDIKVMKLIVSGIKNKVPTELIRSRMRDLYA